MKKGKNPPEKEAEAAPKKSKAEPREPFSRISRIHAALQRGTYPTYARLAVEIEASERTVCRDIEFMRERMGMPIAFCRKNGGFYYTEPVVHLPTLQISEAELLTLCTARQVFEQYRGTRFEARLRSAFEKLTKSMGSESSVPWEEVESAISFRTTALEVVTDFTLVETLRGTILALQEIEFFYTKLHDTRPEKRHGYPLHLLCLDYAWYLFTYDTVRNDIRVFALSRMERLRTTGRNFEKPTSFRPEEHLAHSIGVYCGEKPERVRLRLDKVAARIMSERRWHATQKLTRTTDGHIELTMDVAITPELERMVMSWGPEMRVMEPRALREKIAANARIVAGWGEDA